MQEEGKWKPYNVDYLERNIRKVFKTGNIDHLSQGTYEFITLHMGFIAHYNLEGFKCEYAGRMDDFRLYLQTSELSRDINFNDLWAIRCESDPQFIKWYGEAYCKSEGEGIRRIVAAAREQDTQPGLPFSALDLAQPKRNYDFVHLEWDGKGHP